MKRYIYPKLPAAKINPFFRIGGSGLANCLFVYAKAIVAADKYDAKIITPTWFNISIGTYLRHQKDKRHYLGLFNSKLELRGLRKLFALLFANKTTDEKEFENQKYDILIKSGIEDGFTPLIPYHNQISKYLWDHVNPNLLDKIKAFNFEGCAAIHVRLGDFSARRRVPIDWYVEQVRKLTNYKHFLLFSDGTDEELRDLLSLPSVERIYFGGAIQDILAISKCSYLIGSDSSFSAWGAFLGQIPCVFYRLQFGYILSDKKKQTICN